MLKNLTVVPLLFLCMLFNGNLSLIDAVRICQSLPSNPGDDQSNTLPSVESDVDCQVEEGIDYSFCLGSPTTKPRVLELDGFPALLSRDLIYTLQKLRI